MIFLPALFLIIVNIFLRPVFGYGNQNLIADWANFLFYLFVFFCGFIMVANERITEAIKRQTWLCLGGGILLLAIDALTQAEVIGLPQPLYLAFTALDTWLWLLVFIGIGKRWLNFSNGLLRYANDAVLPVYILHQTVIVVLGFYVIQWNWSVSAKYPFIVISVFIICLLVYEIVRRNFITRFLFGIKTRAAKNFKSPKAAS